jgi:ankyrin repeat protein
LLLEKGAEPNAADNYGNTALHRACSKGHMKIAEILLDQYKASVNQPDTEGNTPL